jgi:hypothetical protein
MAWYNVWYSYMALQLKGSGSWIWYLWLVLQQMTLLRDDIMYSKNGSGILVRRTLMVLQPNGTAY